MHKNNVGTYIPGMSIPVITSAHKKDFWKKAILLEHDKFSGFSDLFKTINDLWAEMEK
jgi:hypothetical protein